MSSRLLYELVESPLHPDLAAVCARLGYERVAFGSQRKALAAIKARPPDVFCADFFYGFGNNYAGANVSNLDVLLRSLQRFAANARPVVFSERDQLAHIDKLAAIFHLHAVITLPAAPDEIEAALR